MDDYVAKPIRSADLIAAIGRVSGTPLSEHGDGDTSLLEPGAVDDKPIACLDEARAMFDGDEDIVQQLLAVFFQDLDRTLGDLRRAAAGRDLVRLREVAHSIKGSVGLFGAAGATDAAHRLEVLAREASPAAFGVGCETLEAEMIRLANALRGSLAAR